MTAEDVSLGIDLAKFAIRGIKHFCSVIDPMDEEQFTTFEYAFLSPNFESIWDKKERSDTLSYYFHEQEQQPKEEKKQATFWDSI